MTGDVSEDLIGWLREASEFSPGHFSRWVQAGSNDELRLAIRAVFSALQSERAARLRVEAALEREKLKELFREAMRVGVDSQETRGMDREGSRDHFASYAADLIRDEALGEQDIRVSQGRADRAAGLAPEC